MRQVYQMTLLQMSKTPFKRGLQNFISRLHWHCHFIQKFESECRIEFENFNRAFDQIQKEKNHSHIQAFETATTGIPIIDANIRCLIQTGYTNFRMRAMLVSFFCFNLWQDWRDLHFLARQFLDYEPGIHYPQLQMQAGTTGINTLRIYNPIKNAMEHDPDGTYVKTWIPELADVPYPIVHTPWLMNESEQLLFNCKVGIDYPAPIVDIESSQKHATTIMWGFKKQKETRDEGERILKKHVKSKPLKKTTKKK
jgi:deoxyribodipyrimidine photo-lyase